MEAKPILKWAGGKQAIIDSLQCHFPREFGYYYEPFLGGASVLLSLSPEKAIVGDRNEWLLETYQAVREDPEKVMSILDEMVNTKEEYYRIRATSSGTLDLFQRAAHLIYLNKTCFRGLFRVNGKGMFNVPYGEYDRRYYDRDNLIAFAEMMKKVDIRFVDFAECVEDASEGDFVYFDPPYVPQGGYSDFDRYTKWKFNQDDHVRLAEVCRDLSSKGVRWAVSNSDTPFVRDLYSGYDMVPIQARREINPKSQKRGIQELLILDSCKREAAIV